MLNPSDATKLAVSEVSSERKRSFDVYRKNVEEVDLKRDNQLKRQKSDRKDSGFGDITDNISLSEGYQHNKEKEGSLIEQENRKNLIESIVGKTENLYIKMHVISNYAMRVFEERPWVSPDVSKPVLVPGWTVERGGRLEVK